MSCKCNKLYLGIGAGIALPIFGAYLMYLTKYEGQLSFPQFIQGMVTLRTIGKLISISMLLNLIVFILAITYEKYILAKGLIIATGIWVAVVVALKLLM